MQADPGDRQPAAPPPRPSVAISAMSPEPPARPRVVHASYWLWIAAFLVGLMTAAATLGYFGELKGLALTIAERQAPQETPATRDRAAAATVATLIGTGVLIVLVQLMLALAMRSGRGWARFALIGLTILGALYSAGMFGTAPAITRVGMITSTALMVIAVVPMFLPGTRAWFAHQRVARARGADSGL